MCGICGLATRRSGDHDAVLTRMSRELARRGPDGEGRRTFFHGGLAIRFGHRRLAIIDAQGSSQPMVSRRTGTAVTFNGEIYNYRALRAELAAEGHLFESGGDTEVLLHGYDAWGLEGLIRRIDGMYAFALWDPRAGLLTLARDPAGQKPLLFCQGPEGELAFASTMAALGHAPWCPSELDPVALELLLCLRYVPAPLTIHKGLRKLLPGEVMTWRDGELRTVSRFHPLAPPWVGTAPCGNWAKGFGHVLESCVTECLEADEPVSLFLSSGLDSGSVAVALGRRGIPQGLRSYTAGFPGAACDETTSAAATAAAAGLTNNVLPVQDEVLRQARKDFLEQLDEPFADPSAIPTLAICSLAAQNAKVALTGDGGDELFGGYPTFAAIAPWRRLRWLPSRGGGMLSGLMAALLPYSDDLHGLTAKAQRFCQGLGHPAHRAFVRWLCVLTPERAARLLGRDGDAVDRLADREAEMMAATEADLFGLMSLLYFRIFLPGVLEKMDRCSMFHSFETRAPFLQRSMIALGFSLPERAKLRGGVSKAVVRDYLRYRLPDTDWTAPKRGFLPPLAQWLRGDTGHELGELLRSGVFSGVLDERLAMDMLKEHRQRRGNHAQALWTLYVLGHFLDKRRL